MSNHELTSLTEKKIKQIGDKKKKKKKKKKMEDKNPLAYLFFPHTVTHTRAHKYSVSDRASLQLQIEAVRCVCCSLKQGESLLVFIKGPDHTD